MRKEILLNDMWLFHKGDIPEPISRDKGFIYSQCKTERKKSGPAAYYYPDKPDDYVESVMSSEKWETVKLPHDYVVCQDNDRNENCALGYLRYDNAWYRRHFKLPKISENSQVLLRFDGVAGNAVPDAAETVNFSVSKPAIIVGTGSDNCDHRSVTNTERKMYMGKIRVAVRPANNQKEFTLTAMSDNFICNKTVKIS